jgi:TolA-binding protein
MAKPIDENKLFVFNLVSIIKYVVGKELIAFLLAFALIYIILPFSPLLFFPINLIITMMVYKLAFDVLAAVAHGDLTPEIKQNYLVTNGIALKVLVIAIIFEGVMFYMKRNGYNDHQQFYFIAFSSFITPAIYMSLALTNSLLFALNPLTIHKTITATIQSYFLCVAFWFVTNYFYNNHINPFLFKYIPVFLNVVISAFIKFSLLIVNFYIMGFLLFQNRYKLVFVTSNTHAIKSSQHENEDETVSENPVYARIKRLLLEDEIEMALDIIKELYENGNQTFELKDLYDEAMRLYYLSDKDRHLPEAQIHKYLSQNNTYKAFSILLELYEAEKEFHERHPEDVYQLAIYAKQANKPKIISKLIKNFQRKYPGHPQIVNNYFLLAQVMYEDRSQRKLAKGILQDLVKKYPHHPLISEIKSWLHGMKLMAKKE